MSDFITRSFDWAQLALASYTNLQAGRNGDILHFLAAWRRMEAQDA
jgi:hypothetical protein